VSYKNKEILVNRAVRAILIVVAVVVVLIIAAAVILPLFIDPNDYRDEVAAMVKKRTGRDLAIEGDLELSVFPWLGIETGAVSLSNPPGFGDKPMAQIARAAVHVKLLPLLSKKIEVDTVTLHGLKLDLITDAAGRTNWADLGGGEKAAAPAPERPAKPGDAAAALGALAVKGVDVSDGEVVWDDRKAGSRFDLSNLELTTGEIISGQPAPVRLAFNLASSDWPHPVPLELSADVGVDADAGKASVADLVLKIVNVKLTVPSVDMDLHSGALSGRLEVPEFDLRDTLSALGAAVQTSDPAAMSRASLSGTFQAGRDSASISGLTAMLDDTHLKGEFAMKNFAKPAMTFGLDVDAIDVDRYAAPAGAPASTAETKKEAVSGAAVLAAPAALVRNLQLDGKLHMGRLKAAGLTMQDINIGVKSSGGQLRITPISGNLYEGTLAGGLGMDARGDVPRVSIDERLSAVQLGPLLRDAGVSKKLAGRGDLGVQLHARGVDKDALVRSLNGRVPFSIRDGLIKGFNLRKLIVQARSLGGAGGEVAAEQSDETRFTEMTGTAVITNGVARVDDLSIKSPLFRIGGKGAANLVAESIDYRLDVTIVGTLEGQGGRELEKLKGATIPVRITGPFGDPQFKVDFGSLIKQETKKAIKKEIHKEIEKKLFKGLFH
jgi:AsmA protein